MDPTEDTMTSPTTYDRLDSAIALMLAEPETALPALDAESDGLLELAAELRTLPRPEFRAALDNDLRQALGLPTRAATAPQLVRPEVALEKALPTLFGGGPATYPVRRKNFALSMAAHAAAIAFIVFSGFALVKHTGELGRPKMVMVGPELGDYVMPVAKSGKSPRGGGGGGTDEKLAATGGRLPQQSTQQLTPPTVVIRNPNPALASVPTVVVDRNLRIPQPNVAQMGDPLAVLGAPPSNGTGSGGGIGEGTGTGVGVGEGPGVGRGRGGNFGGDAFRVGGGVSAPRTIYAPDPEYSDEARKAKYQGAVTLWVVVGPDGRVREARIARSLGMGLDEKALAAVRTWRFEPAYKDSVPVPVQVNIEVHFRLY
jgi:protein TonB